MFIPLRALHARLCAGDDHGRYTLDCLRLERDADGKPWLVATNGRALVCVTWTEPEETHNEKMLGETYKALLPGLERRPGFAVLLPAQVARMVARACRKREGGFLGPVQSCDRWLLVAEEPNYYLRSPIGDRLCEVSLSETGKDGKKFPDYRSVLASTQKAVLDAPVAASVPVRLAPWLVGRLCKSLRRMGLDYVELNVAAHDGGVPFGAWEAEGTATRLRANGVIMPLKREALGVPTVGTLAAPV
jgi:hypothetical protein